MDALSKDVLIRKKVYLAGDRLFLGRADNVGVGDDRDVTVNVHPHVHFHNVAVTKRHVRLRFQW